MQPEHAINWTTVLVSVLAALVGGTGLIAGIWKGLVALAERRMEIREGERKEKQASAERERQEKHDATEAENVWLRRHVEELYQRLEDQEKRFDARLAQLEEKYEQAREKRHAIANELAPLKLENELHKRENASLALRIGAMELEEARLRRELADLKAIVPTSG